MLILLIKSEGLLNKDVNEQILLLSFVWNALKMDSKTSGPPADLELQVHPHVRRIDGQPIWAESQPAWVISPAAVATAPDGSGGIAVGCTVIQDF